MNNKGFTFVELLAVIVLIGVLSSIAVYGVTNTINNSKIKGEEIFIDRIDKLIEAYLSNIQLNNNINLSPMILDLDESNNLQDDTTADDNNIEEDNNESFVEDNNVLSDDDTLEDLSIYYNIEFNKCNSYKKSGDDLVCRESENSEAILYGKEENDEVSLLTLNDILIDNKNIDNRDLINPSTKEKIQYPENIKIYIFRDTEYVYYYYVDLNGECSEKDKCFIKYTSSIINNIPDSFCVDENKSIIDQIDAISSNTNICVKEES